MELRNCATWAVKIRKQFYSEKNDEAHAEDGRLQLKTLPSITLMKWPNFNQSTFEPVQPSM
jgi:hypothetical protein